MELEEFFRVVKLFEGDYFNHQMAQSLFKKVDTDQNGYIDEAEFICFIRDNTKDKSDTEFSKLLDELVETGSAIETNKTQQELADISAQSADRTQQIQSAFAAIDIDRNRAIDVNEFFEVGKLVHGAAHSTDWTWEKCQRIFDKIDTDNDGAIDEAEFTIHLKEVTKTKSEPQFKAMMENYKVPSRYLHYTKSLSCRKH